jgi:hypothetical protein
VDGCDGVNMHGLFEIAADMLKYLAKGEYPPIPDDGKQATYTAALSLALDAREDLVKDLLESATSTPIKQIQSYLAASKAIISGGWKLETSGNAYEKKCVNKQQARKLERVLEILTGAEQKAKIRVDETAGDTPLGQPGISYRVIVDADLLKSLLEREGLSIDGQRGI